MGTVRKDHHPILRTIYQQKFYWHIYAGKELWHNNVRYIAAKLSIWIIILLVPRTILQSNNSSISMNWDLKWERNFWDLEIDLFRAQCRKIQISNTSYTIPEQQQGFKVQTAANNTTRDFLAIGFISSSCSSFHSLAIKLPSLAIAFVVLLRGIISE